MCFSFGKVGHLSHCAAGTLGGRIPGSLGLVSPEGKALPPSSYPPPNPPPNVAWDRPRLGCVKRGADYDSDIDIDIVNLFSVSFFICTCVYTTPYIYIIIIIIIIVIIVYPTQERKLPFQPLLCVAVAPVCNLAEADRHGYVACSV